MKTMQMNWKRSLATFALLASFNSSDAAPAPADSGKSGAAPVATAAVSPPPASASVGADADSKAADAFRRRYGLEAPPGGAPTSAAPNTSSRQALLSQRRGQIEAKLKKMVLPEVKFDSLPLSEVVIFLSDQCRKLDPEKEGVNFLLNPNSPPTSWVGALGTVDPTTGLPSAPAAPTEQVDLSQVTVRITLPLRKVTMEDLLDAIVKVADHAIEYSVEDYAVVFSLRPEAVPPQPLVTRAGLAMELPLVVRTFKVDTNNFFAGLENAFGIKREFSPKDDSKLRSQKVQSALRDLLTQLGISMTPNKSIFYNDLTGVVMVRATPDDQEFVGAAIQTLGGDLVGTSFGGGGGFGAASPGNPPPATTRAGNP